MKQIDSLNDELTTRQESIDLLKGRLKNQIPSFKETIAKVLDSNTSLGEKIRTLFTEQGITIASILTAIYRNGYRGTCWSVIIMRGAPQHREASLLLKTKKV